MKTKLQKDIKKQSTLINLRYLYLYFPETSLNFSYNKRATNQDWIIAEDDNEFEGDTKFYNRKRSLKEEYPEIGIKFSMPINLYSSIKGKVNLLKSFEKEVQIRETELTSETDIFAANLVTEYNKNKKMYELQKKIFELNEKSFNNLSQKYLIEPSILSITPEETLKQKELDLKKEEIDLITAEMHLKKIMFICLKFIGN